MNSTLALISGLGFGLGLETSGLGLEALGLGLGLGLETPGLVNIPASNHSHPTLLSGRLVVPDFVISIILLLRQTGSTVVDIKYIQ